MEDINDQVEELNTQEASTETVSQETEEPKKPANVLLGAISYENEDDYQKFLDGMDINQALFVIVSGCTHAQSKSAYTLAEAELISKAIKAIKNKSVKQEPSNEAPQS